MFKPTKLLGMLTLIGCLSLNVSFAEQTAPTKCPILAASQFTWDTAMQNQGVWSVVQFKNRYNTDQEWTLFAAPVLASSEQEAYAQATKLAPTLSLIEGPIADRDEKGQQVWCCLYVGEEIFGIAITPPRDTTANRLMKFVRRHH